VLGFQPEPDREGLDEYRRMFPSERLRLTFGAIREQTPYLFVGTDDVVTRRCQSLDRENRLRTGRILIALKRLAPSPSADRHG